MRTCASAGEAWRTYGLQTLEGVIQIAQPLSVREAFARGAALRVVIAAAAALPHPGRGDRRGRRSGLRPLRRSRARCSGATCTA